MLRRPLVELSLPRLASLLVLGSAAAQDRVLPYPVTEPAVYRAAIAAGTRSESGAPGPRAWTDGVRQVIEATLDPVAATVTGRLELSYTNRSPEPTDEIWFHLHQNLHLPQAMRRPGVQSAGFLMFRRHGQMIPTTPDHAYVGIYKLNDANAWQGWQGADALAQAPCVDQSSLRITHWDRLTERLTRDDVQNPTSASLAAEEQARARMGDRVLTGGVEKLGSA